VEQIFFSQDGKRLLSVSDTTVIVWDAQTGDKIATLKGHSGRVITLNFFAFLFLYYNERYKEKYQEVRKASGVT
jgi:WD40 repeat protein